MFNTKNTKDIWQRNIIFFFIYTIFYATVNILPQFFFLEYYPKEKSTYLLVLLILGSLISVVGVHLAQSYGYIWPDKKKVVKVIFLSSSILSALLFVVPHWLPYLIFFLLLKILINFLMQFIDQNFIFSTPKNLLSTHANSNSFYQLIAIITSSIYLGFFYHYSLLNAVLFAVIPILSLLISTEKFPEMKKGMSVQNKPKGSIWQLISYQKSFLIYSAFVFCSYGIFSSMLIYFLNDFYSISDPKTKGGIILALTCTAGAISIIFISPKILRSEKVNFAPKAVFLMSLVNIASLILFTLKPYNSFLFISILSIMTGFCYGLFMSLSRNVVSQFVKETPTSNVLSIYNNLPNYSFLFGFIVTLLIQWIAPLLNISAHLLTLITITAYFPISLLFYFKSYNSFQLRNTLT
jgi:MFS family permease